MQFSEWVIKQLIGARDNFQQRRNPLTKGRFDGCKRLLFATLDLKDGNVVTRRRRSRFHLLSKIPENQGMKFGNEALLVGRKRGSRIRVSCRETNRDHFLGSDRCLNPMPHFLWPS